MSNLERVYLRAFAVLTAIVAAGSLLVPSSVQAEQLPDYVVEEFGSPPEIPVGAVSEEVAAAIEAAFIQSIEQGQWGPEEQAALQVVAVSGDPRLAWLVSDLMRFITNAQLNAQLVVAAQELLQADLGQQDHWGGVTDHLIAWDIPAPPDYLRIKRAIFTGLIPGWEQIFVEGDIDWRLVSWGGVLIDDRAFDTTDEPCNCIPAADNPEVTLAEEATWLDDDDIVFGVEVNGAYRAYPRQIMEVREMVNDTLGGRDLGIPYCTLCGAAQAYFTDQMPEGVDRPVLRTSGLLSRSNKVMYDLNTYSVFDTFLGHAVTGPLAEIGVQLEQATVVTTDWASWKTAHPNTTVLAEYLALGRDPDFRNGRDADGPIFPVGDVDPRLPVHEDIIGVVTGSGGAVAFQRGAALLALRAGQVVAFQNVRLVLEAGGIKAVGKDGEDLGSHEAFWFAWSQFHPGTALWLGA
ncbi:DUF3179 domain-containing (seleno)protein [Shimia sp. Alg240-R146]|uniref:DUF3179 domain-containing (seleno)protein n=1 Tax=Shimia sp. Alg240-R146 TaxID=2993449 RepID=UPI0022E88AF4|nr:DUF3179 domain-containing (seleno)protein [Shimia sp. Alg240-R146]